MQTTAPVFAFKPLAGLSVTALFATIASAMGYRSRVDGLLLHVRLEEANRDLARLVDDQKKKIELEHSLRERDARLARIGRLSGLIAHDLRNPLASTISYAELARSAARLGDGPEAESYIRELLKEAKRLGRMVEEVLDVSSDGDPNVRLAPCLLSDFIKDVSGPIRDYAGVHGIDVEVDLRTSGVVMVDLDWDRMHRVIENLTSNAHKSLIRSAPAEGGRTIRLAATADDRSITIRVVDNGDGVDPSMADILFEPHATDGEGGGIGIGLANARQIVTAHGGTIELERTPAGGGRVVRHRPAAVAAGPGRQEPAPGQRTVPPPPNPSPSPSPSPPPAG